MSRKMALQDCSLEIRVDEGSTVAAEPGCIEILAELNYEFMTRGLPWNGASVAEREIRRLARVFDIADPAEPIGRLSGEAVAVNAFTAAAAESYIERIRCLRPYGRSGRIVVGIDDDRQVIPLDGRRVRRIVTVDCTAFFVGDAGREEIERRAGRLAATRWGPRAAFRMSYKARASPDSSAYIAGGKLDMDWDDFFPHRRSERVEIEEDGLRLLARLGAIIEEREEESPP